MRERLKGEFVLSSSGGWKPKVRVGFFCSWEESLRSPWVVRQCPRPTSVSNFPPFISTSVVLGSGHPKSLLSNLVTSYLQIRSHSEGRGWGCQHMTQGAQFNPDTTLRSVLFHANFRTGLSMSIFLRLRQGLHQICRLIWGGLTSVPGWAFRSSSLVWLSPIMSVLVYFTHILYCQHFDSNMFITLAPEYVILFRVNRKGVAFLISIFKCSWLLYRHAIDFCSLIFLSPTLLSPLITSKGLFAFCRLFSIVYIDNHIIHKYRQFNVFHPSICVPVSPLPYHSGWMRWRRTAGTAGIFSLFPSSEGEHPVLHHQVWC